MAQAKETTSTCVEFVEKVSLGDIETHNWEGRLLLTLG